MRKLLAAASAALPLVSADPIYAAVRIASGSSATKRHPEVAIELGQSPLSAPAGATGKYVRDTINTTGWATLEIHTNASYKDADTAYAAGYLEGYTTAVEIQQFAINAHAGKLPYSTELAVWVAENTDYVSSQITANPSEPFWYHVGLTVQQAAGLYDGYSAAIPTSEKLSKEVIYALTLVGDLDDLCPAFGCTQRLGKHTCRSKAECEAVPTGPALKDRTHGNGHCSILVKPLGYVGAPTDIVFGHTTWSPYTLMGPRIMKNYGFSWQTAANNTAVVPGTTIVFTSYPAVLYSFDDWYTINSGLTVSETTIINENPALWSSVGSSSVLIWSRAMVANRLASNAAQWTAVVAQQNSGTYNNAWHVVDWNVWTPGNAIPDGFLWQTEQMPGVMKPIDLTPILRAQTYWSSYNRVFDPYLFNLTGQWPLVQKYGPHYTWDQTARAQIFRRNQSMVVDLDSYASLLRYNDFQNDTISTQGCNGGVHSASNAISERGDLSPTNGCIAGSDQSNEGGIDCKYTSYKLLAAGKHKNVRMMAQAGPTYDQQPVFKWSGSPFDALSHLGQPDEWQFPWVDFDDQWE